MPFSNLRSTKVHYDASAVQNMISMLKTAPFPTEAPVDASEPWSLGIDFDYLKKLKATMETTWKWENVEAEIGKYDNFLADYKSEDGVDEMTLHFVHVRSQRQDAIPLILMHGWPGTFYDFHKVIEPLTNPPTGSAELPAFHVVIPSLPGYFKSTLPRRNGWNLIDIAKLYHGLMSEVLGYDKYAAQGGDWGCMILRFMSNLFADKLIAAHFNLFRSGEPGPDEELSETEKMVIARRSHFRRTGRGYVDIQSTKPFTIGWAIGSSPLAILTWIGEKIYTWSDPERLDPVDIIDAVALYWLSGCFATSVIIYNQSFELGMVLHSPTAHVDWPVKSKFGFSSFPYEVGGGHRAGIAKFGNLTFYKEHERGGHFPALDSPTEFVEDLREFFGKNYN